MGDELPVTVNRVVKVYIASKRKIQVGDKLAGRHGNKGVVAKILPPEDMPYMPDGTPDRRGPVAARRAVPDERGPTVGTTFGWAASILGVEPVTPVFDGATEEHIQDMMRQAKKKLLEKGWKEEWLASDDGRIALRDGRTGELFANKVTVGYMYILKLAHLVEDKIHARSTGPYSLITRQPLGGKAQFGGQRFRRNGSVGHRRVRRGAHAARIFDGEIRRRPGPHQDVRSHHPRRRGDRTRRSGKLPRAGAGTAVPGLECGIDEVGRGRGERRRQEDRGQRSRGEGVTGDDAFCGTQERKR
jgi:hypothetical protein